MYALPYVPEDARKEIMSSVGISGIPSLIVMDSTGKIITKYGRSAVDGNSKKCVEEWLKGKPGTTWISAINWAAVLFYPALFLIWWWFTSK
jgi:hypothetical protein